MKIGDYLSFDTVKELTEEEFLAFRNYLKMVGYSIMDGLGVQQWRLADFCLLLDEDGDLSWFHESSRCKGWCQNGKEITLDEVKRMAKMGMLE